MIVAIGRSAATVAKRAVITLGTLVNPVSLFTAIASAFRVKRNSMASRPRAGTMKTSRDLLAGPSGRWREILTTPEAERDKPRALLRQGQRCSTPMRIYRDKYQSATGYIAASSPLVTVRIIFVFPPCPPRFRQGRTEGNKLQADSAESPIARDSTRAPEMHGNVEKSEERAVA